MWKKAVLWFTALLMTVLAQAVNAPPGPSALRAPANEKLLWQARGVGVQVYTCQSADGKFTWTLKGPEAKLLGSDGQTAGRHFAGPTWAAKDGSQVKGKAVASIASPDAGAVPWLLLRVVAHEGKGLMSGVESIQRLGTAGGAAAKRGCDSSHLGVETRVPYQADYYFWGHSE